MNRDWIAHNVRARRAAMGWTQDELATAAGLAASTLRKVERQLPSAPNVTTLAALAGALGCTVDDLLRQPEGEATYPGHGPTPKESQKKRSDSA